jgi:hypothetical protein
MGARPDSLCVTLAVSTPSVRSMPRGLRPLSDQVLIRVRRRYAGTMKSEWVLCLILAACGPTNRPGDTQPAGAHRIRQCAPAQ